jgi:hypothetical protein
MSYTPPELNKLAFTCPRCGVYSRQIWSGFLENFGPGWSDSADLRKSRCNHCNKDGIWLGGTLLDPDQAPAPMPHPDMPEDCKNDFLEARSIISRSPRGAAALLRLVIQKLLPSIGGEGKKIDTDIALLVQKGLAVEVQQALDACRVIGNNSVHPGEMNISDTPEIAVQMCELINFIVDNRISQPKKIRAIYSSLPAKNIAAIEARDKKTD